MRAGHQSSCHKTSPIGADLPEIMEDGAGDHVVLARSMNTDSTPKADTIVAQPKPTTKRPLRTYSKRSLSDRDVEPAQKKRRVGEAPQRTQSAPSTTTKPETPQPAPLPPRSPSKRGTIMYFFQSMKSSSSLNTIPSDARTGAIPAVSSQPSSPPLPTGTGKAKRSQKELDRKGSAHDTAKKGVSLDLEEKQDAHADFEQDSEGSPGESDAQAVEGQDEDASAEADTSGLRDGDENTMNKGRRRSRKKTSAKAKTTVQTTLSLTRETGFKECKDCNIVYNPLHEKDAKFHARRHAAVLRKRSAD